jgi:O-acetylhomoserine/O-acetylserine sulfhydrylase-like pyridoxal-dependent enzyme
MEEILMEQWFPEFTEPSAGYHGLVYHEALEMPLLLLK